MAPEDTQHVKEKYGELSVKIDILELMMNQSLEKVNKKMEDYLELSLQCLYYICLGSRMVFSCRKCVTVVDDGKNS